MYRMSSVAELPPPRVATGGVRSVRMVKPLLLAALLAGSMACRNDDDRAVLSLAEGSVEPASFTSPDTLLVELTRDGPLARRVADYRLTPERVSQWSQAQRRLDAVARTDTLFLRRTDAELRTRRFADPVDHAIARLESDPAARRAIEDAGLTPREYVYTMLAVYQAQRASAADAPPALRALAAENAVLFTERRIAVDPVERRQVRYVVDRRDDDSDWDTDGVDSDADSERRRPKVDEGDTESDSERRKRRRERERDRERGRERDRDVVRP